ncbi:hypothetical protein V6N11_040194 [Hibiscus sabdariffa]|uniref:Uncharacterized protein n=1 Tax=Hibiscus sabdariffa TaxID=183260 RepID=A0ABR2RH04_9ROSI
MHRVSKPSEGPPNGKKPSPTPFSASLPPVWLARTEREAKGEAKPVNPHRHLYRSGQREAFVQKQRKSNNLQSNETSHNTKPTSEEKGGHENGGHITLSTQTFTAHTTTDGPSSSSPE